MSQCNALSAGRAAGDRATVSSNKSRAFCRDTACGSANTKIDRWKLDNYRLGVLYAVVVIFGEPPAGKFDRVCSDCQKKFTP